MCSLADRLSAASRAFVHEDIAERFVAELKTVFEKATAGLGRSPLEVETEHGPVVDHLQFDKIMSFISSGKKSAELVTGGRRKGSSGCFIEPTIFLNPTDDSPVLNEEIFGPVLCIKTFKSEEEVIALANNTVYGLAGKSAPLLQHKAMKLITDSSMYIHGRYRTCAPSCEEDTKWRRVGQHSTSTE